MRSPPSRGGVSGLPSPRVPQGLQGQLPPLPQGFLGPQHFIGRQLDLVSWALIVRALTGLLNNVPFRLRRVGL